MLRWGEAAGLRVRDRNLTQRRIRAVNHAVEVGSKDIVGTPKNHRRRTVPLPTLIVDFSWTGRRWKTRVELANAMFDYLEIWHNRRRRHSQLGWLTPCLI